MKKYTLTIAFIISAILLITACQKEVNKATNKVENFSAPASEKNQSEKKVYVSNLEELYVAINDVNNAGARIIMAPGTYVLNSSYPNGGRLELQTGMSLQGQPGQSDAVIIDLSSLPGSSFAISAGSTGGIRMGRGDNSLEWLTVNGAAAGVNPFSIIETDLPSTETSIRVAHIVINGNGNRIGINIRNRLAEHAGRKIYAELEHNEITGLVSSFGFGLMVVNANSASNALIQVNMKENYIHGNKVGIIVGNNAINRTIENSRVEIISHADKLEGNGVALDPSGGVNQSTTTFANNNTTTIEIHGSSITGNNPANSPLLQPVNGALPGGVYAAGGYNSVNNIAAYNRASNNTLKLEFFGCDISDNNGVDIYAFGAWCPPATVLAGTNNLAEIYLQGVSAKAIVEATASVPAEAAGTNTINVYRN